jgi:hypothetical protein
MRRFKAFIIATISLFDDVKFKRKQKVAIKIDHRNHPILMAFLDLFFDLRRWPSGKTELWLKQRRKANYERGIPL